MLRKNLSLVCVIVVLMLAKTIWSVSEETPEISRPWKRVLCLVGTRWRTRRCGAVSRIKKAKFVTRIADEPNSSGMEVTY
ncbi:hypothetical protein ABFA07_014760 [Porites harrisoni]